ncbi:hypothetical protein H0X32_03480 [Patescibacteria group bacterium]|nr:hypothetical protein [Patescibacteria group bacterium]
MYPPSTSTNAPLNDFITKAETQILTPLITLLALAAFVIFIWGVITYIRNADNDEKRKEGTRHMLWGVIGLTIIFGASAIVTIIGNTANSLFK